MYFAMALGIVLLVLFIKSFKEVRQKDKARLADLKDFNEFLSKIEALKMKLYISKGLDSETAEKFSHEVYLSFFTIMTSSPVQYAIIISLNGSELEDYWDTVAINVFEGGSFTFSKDLIIENQKTK